MCVCVCLSWVQGVLDVALDVDTVGEYQGKYETGDVISRGQLTGQPVITICPKQIKNQKT